MIKEYQLISGGYPHGTGFTQGGSGACQDHPLCVLVLGPLGWVSGTGHGQLFPMTT